MKFPELLISAIRGSEIPLRFEPGAEEAVAKPIADLVRVWLEVHEPGADERQRILIDRLLSELDGELDVPE